MAVRERCPTAFSGKVAAGWPKKMRLNLKTGVADERMPPKCAGAQSGGLRLRRAING
jgi:hypothetical protein